jgi:polyprenyl P-hydroxybenzoate and phenylacrylic acid decarboxylases
LGITGASGAILSKRLLEFLSDIDVELNVVATRHGLQVFEYETRTAFNDYIKSISNRRASIRVHDNEHMFAPIASGSYGVECMAIVPCSMSTAGKLAVGCADNLLTRAADVCLKEGARLVLSPREAPLHAVHLKNLLTLSELGAKIVPPVPAFYDREYSYDLMVDGIVGRLLRAMGISNTLYRKWE